MSRKHVVCLAGLLLAASARGEELRGKLALKDASNADRPVGASVETGIPQGHVLKVVINEARFGKVKAAEAPVVVSVRRGAEVVATAEGALDKAGLGAVLVPVGADWDGRHHLDAAVTEAYPSPAGASKGRLQGEFCVIEGEPSPEVPFALPAALAALAAVTMVIWWTRRSPQTA